MRSTARKHPKSICIETIGACNGSCLFCPYKRLGSPHAKLVDETVYRLIDEISKLSVERVSLFNNNEPLLDDRLPKFIQYARKRLGHRRLTLSTNGKLITGSLLEQYIDMGVDRFFISVPSLDKEAYLSLMGHDLTEVVDAILSVSEGKRGNIRIAVPRTKYFDAESFERTFLEHGIKYIVWDLECIDSWSECLAISSICRGYEAPGCDRPLDQLIIKATGDVALCCRDWGSEGSPIGNVNEMSIEEIWGGSKMMEYQSLIIEQKFESLPICSNCSRIRGLHEKR